MRVLSVASEAYPIIKTGGLADVVGALPAALGAHGVTVTTLLPGYASVLKAMGPGEVVHSYKSLMGGKAQIVRHTSALGDLLLLDAPGLFGRDGGPYSDAKGKDHIDNWKRFAALSRAACDLADGIVPAFLPDLVHAHDWQAAMTPVYMHYSTGRAATVPSLVTIHNLAFQGRFGGDIFAQLGLPAAAFALDGLEFYGDVSYLKGALMTAGAITTVSPTYANEIRTPEFGAGLDGVIRQRGDDVSGIVNGIDTTVWDPMTDPALPAHYSEGALALRVTNRKAIEQALMLKGGSGPLLCVVSRLTEQKGLDVLADMCDDVVAMGARLAVLGAGDPLIERALLDGAARHPGRIGVKIGYDEGFSHLLQGGSDAIVIPSRFEPCGLTQLYGLRYGCVPIVARTGGLADTVIDANVAALNASVATGFQFDGVTHDTLRRTLRRAVDAFGERTVWRRLQKRGMRGDYDWTQSGARYAELYNRLTTPKA